MANESNTAGETGTDEGVHRLHDIVAEEVSLVDRAANKRRFLVVKRAVDPAADGARRPGRSGSARRGPAKPGAPAADGVGKARRRGGELDREDEDEESDDANKARSADAEGDEDDEEEDEDEEEDDEANDDTQKADDDNEGKQDEEDEEDEDEADEAADDSAKSDARATKAEAGATVLPSKLKDALLGALSQALERLMGVANQIKDAETTDADADASVPADIGDELEDIGELLGDIGEQLPTGADNADNADKAAVAKAGARMARSRLDRFQKALQLLSDVLKELTSAERSAGSAPAATGSKATKAVAGPAPAIAELVTSVTALTRMVKSQQDDLAQLRRSRATSNALAVEGARSRPSQDVSWPLDMNRPISRDTVSKSVSFYDE